MAFRPRKSELRYRKLRKVRATTSECPFCAFKDGDGQVVREYPLFYVAKNNFPYELWECLPVIDHLMITPKRHVDSLHHLTTDERQAYMDITAEYDEKGYSLYTRTSSNVSKSIVHLHTHLLKLGDHAASFSLYVEKPYILWHN